MMWPHDHDRDHEAGHERCPRCGAYDDCGEGCVAAVEAHMAVRWLYTASRSALRLARRYRAEQGPGSDREAEAIQAIRRHRAAIKDIRKSGETHGIRQSDKAAE